MDDLSFALRHDRDHAAPFGDTAEIDAPRHTRRTIVATPSYRVTSLVDRLNAYAAVYDCKWCHTER